MDKIKGFIDGIKGDDDKLDLNDVKREMGSFNLDDLKSLNWPIQKADLVAKLKQKGTNEHIIDAVERVPQDRFDDLNDLKSKIGM